MPVFGLRHVPRRPGGIRLVVFASSRFIRAICLDKTGDVDMAADLTQEVFLRVLMLLKKITCGLLSGRGWLQWRSQICQAAKRTILAGPTNSLGGFMMRPPPRVLFITRRSKHPVPRDWSGTGSPGGMGDRTRLFQFTTTSTHTYRTTRKAGAAGAKKSRFRGGSRSVPIVALRGCIQAVTPGQSA